jgi:hypothetical protein
MRNANPKPGAALNLLAARAEALRSFDVLPDDALIGYRELAILENRSEDTLRQARRLGRLPIPRHGSNGKVLRFRVGDVRAYLRGVAAA